MHWNSLDAFLAMGGYGFYVWGSFGITALCCLIELITLNSRKQKSTLEKLS
jgi:heme exporter protein D